MLRLPVLSAELPLRDSGAAAPLSPAAKAEIDGLLSRLEASGAKFSRNGSWHSAAEPSRICCSSSNISKTGAVQSAEQFIELAASKSSVSGTPIWSSAAGGAVPSACGCSPNCN
jgi:hypothetical protein